MASVIELDFTLPDPGIIPFMMGDALLIKNTPATPRTKAYVYKFTANGQVIDQYYLSGVSMDTGMAPEKLYVLPDTLTQTLAPGQTEIEVDIEMRYRDMYLPPENDIILGNRKLLVTIDDTKIISARLIESPDTQSIFNYLGSFIQRRSRIALELSANAPNGSSIARVDLFDGQNSSGTVLASYIAQEPTPALTGHLIIEDASPMRAGNQHRTLVITDLRGRTVTMTIPVYITPYAPPSISTLLLRRCDASGTPMAGGTRVLVAASIHVSSLLKNGTEKNTPTLSIKFRRAATNDAWTSASLELAAGDVERQWLLPSAVYCDLETAYAFDLTLSDYFSSVSRNTLVAQSHGLISFHKDGRALSIGKRAQLSDTMEVALPARFEQDVGFDKAVTVAGGLTLLAPLGIGEGGTGVTTLAELKALVNEADTSAPTHLCGAYTFNITANAVNQTYTVNFSKAFPTTPFIFLQLQLNSGYNKVTYAVSFRSATYFQFMVSNEQSAAKSCTIMWTAMINA